MYSSRVPSAPECAARTAPADALASAAQGRRCASSAMGRTMAKNRQFPANAAPAPSSSHTARLSVSTARTSRGASRGRARTSQSHGSQKSLRDKGCHNWNLVTATQWLPLVREAAVPLITSGRCLPFVYNTSGYERLETLEEYADLIDIALTDLRYATPDLARRCSAAADYVEVSRRALLWFCGRLGPLELDDEGIARKGVICRLLVLPGHPEEAIANLRWIAENIGTELDISVMSQYTPVHRAAENGEFGRRVTREEYEMVTDEAERLGFENGWIQPYEDDASSSLVGCEMKAGEGTVG